MLRSIAESSGRWITLAALSFGIAGTGPAWAEGEDATPLEVAQQTGAPASAEAPATAPAAAAEEPQELEAVVVTGTRVRGRSPAQSLSPIDAVGGADLERQAGVELTDELRVTVPSFNTQRYPISDGTAFIRPANLRNLSPDQTLVLVNGHRRHRSALVNLQVEPFGTVNQGAQAVDFALIPAAAVERVEVLRDGASAQYGSDAIAGVINVLLKQNPRGLSLAAQSGASYSGDGENTRVSANAGLPMAGGFFNVTGEYLKANHTSTGSPRPDAAAVDAARPGTVPFDGLGQRWGDPDVEGERLFFNTEFEATDVVRVYGHGNYASSDFISSFFYRTPVGVAGVTPRGTLWVDADADGAADPVDQAIVDALVAQGSDPGDYLTADASSPSGYVAHNPISSRFPGGYTPSFGAEVRDWEGVLGIRNQVASGLSWDFSGRYGVNRVAYLLENSINPSLGRLSPVNFRPGVLEQRESGANLDLVYPVAVQALAAPLNVAFGAEYRTEVYEIGIGDPASFESSPTAVLFGVGSDGFQGDSPDAAGTFGRSSRAVYLDLETDVVKALSLGVAGRFEDSNAFDSTIDWKVAARLAPLDWFALRATASTGFRAPTPGQVNTLDVTTTADASGALVPLGTFPVNSLAAVALGATPVEPEESFNLTTGIVFTPFQDFSFSLDYYNIEVTDRIALANIVIDTPEERQALVDAGVENAALLGSVSFFTNAFDTTVEGFDAAASYRADLGGAGYVLLDLRHAYVEQTVDRFQAGTIDAERVFDLQNQLPRNRSIFSVNYQSPFRVDALVRASYYDQWEDLTFGEQATFDAKTLVDLVLTGHVRDRFHIAVGAENLFDTAPDEETNSVLRFLGATSPVSSPFGTNGGLWFVRLSADL